MGKKSDLSSECQKFEKSCLPFLVRKRQRRSQFSHLIGYIKRHQNTKFHLSAASAKTIRNITVTFLVSTPNSK
jgi:hypothetical protein